MNQTIHTRQVLHAFAHRGDVPERRVPDGAIGAGHPNEHNERRGRFAGARRVAITVLVLAPLIVVEIVLGAVASDGWITDMLKNSALLLALTQPF